jgi:predicted peptidase
MRRLLAVAVFVLGLVPGRAADAGLTAQLFQRTLSQPVSYKYLLALPVDYARRPEKRWPLLLFLHGAGERGDDVWAVAVHGPPKLLRSDPSSAAAKLLAENFIVVAPQCAAGEWWNPAHLLALLDDIAAHHRIDPQRVYLTGLSMGGFGAWDLGVAYPERFAAIAPICGGGAFATVYLANEQKRTDLRALAVWAFHGAQDETVPLVESQRMIDLLRSARVVDVQLTVYPDERHDSWTRTYANPELYTWLLEHARPAPRPTK